MKIVHKKAPAEFARFGRNIFNLSGDDKTTAEESVKQYLIWLKSIQAPQSYMDIAKPGQEISIKGLQHVAETAYSIYDKKIGKLVSLNLDEVKELLIAGMTPYTIEQ